ncbi:hypothetical protein [Streptomyces prunicolor]
MTAATHQIDWTQVVNFDNHGSLWGYDTIEHAEAVVAEAYTNGSDVNEWHITALDGQPYRIVRIADPTFLDDICIIPA